MSAQPIQQPLSAKDRVELEHGVHGTGPDEFELRLVALGEVNVPHDIAIHLRPFFELLVNTQGPLAATHDIIAPLLRGGEGWSAYVGMKQVEIPDPQPLRFRCDLNNASLTAPNTFRLQMWNDEHAPELRGQRPADECLGEGTFDLEELKAAQRIDQKWPPHTVWVTLKALPGNPAGPHGGIAAKAQVQFIRLMPHGPQAK